MATPNCGVDASVTTAAIMVSLAAILCLIGLDVAGMMHPFIHSFIPSFIHSSLHSFIHPFIHPFIH